MFRNSTKGAICNIAIYFFGFATHWLVERLSMHETLQDSLLEDTNYSNAIVPSSKHYNELEKQAVFNKPVEETEKMKLRRQVELLMTFDDPHSYRGPYLKGWPPSQNRSMDLYIHPNRKTIPLINDACFRWEKTDLEMVFFIQTAPEFSDNRMSIRKTWMEYQKTFPKMKVIFVFGTAPPALKSKIDKLLVTEQETYCDMVQFDFVDGYSNGTLRAVLAMKYLRQQKWTKEPKMVFIGDDDVYINLPQVWKMLFGSDKPPTNEESIVLWGCLLHHPSRTIVHLPEDNLLNAKYVPYHGWSYTVRYMYNKFNYPELLNGHGYVIPYKLTECLYQMSLELPFFNLHDVFVTGFARELCGFELAHDENWCMGPDHIKGIGESALLVHQIHNIFDMGKIHRKLSRIYSKEKNEKLNAKNNKPKKKSRKKLN